MSVFSILDIWCVDRGRPLTCVGSRRIFLKRSIQLLLSFEWNRVWTEWKTFLLGSNCIDFQAAACCFSVRSLKISCILQLQWHGSHIISLAILINVAIIQVNVRVMVLDAQMSSLFCFVQNRISVFLFVLWQSSWIETAAENFEFQELWCKVFVYYSCLYPFAFLIVSKSWEVTGHLFSEKQGMKDCHLRLKNSFMTWIELLCATKNLQFELPWTVLETSATELPSGFIPEEFHMVSLTAW